MTDSTTINAKMAETFTAVFRELQQETDRGSVVLGIAWIDEELTSILRKLCLPSPATSPKSDELFGVGAPFGDLATKIDFAYRMGLVRAYVRKSLHLLRKLRNDFAHRSTPISFNTTEVRDRILEIFHLENELLEAIWQSVSELPAIKVAMANTAPSSHFEGLVSALGTRALLHMTLALVVAALVYTQTQVTPIQPLE